MLQREEMLQQGKVLVPLIFKHDIFVELLEETASCRAYPAVKASVLVVSHSFSILLNST